MINFLLKHSFSETDRNSNGEDHNRIVPFNLPDMTYQLTRDRVLDTLNYNFSGNFYSDGHTVYCST